MFFRVAFMKEFYPVEGYDGKKVAVRPGFERVAPCVPDGADDLGMPFHEPAPRTANGRRGFAT
jgi:hypothetical protein